MGRDGETERSSNSQLQQRSASPDLPSLRFAYGGVGRVGQREKPGIGRAGNGRLADLDIDKIRETVVGLVRSPSCPPMIGNAVLCKKFLELGRHTTCHCQRCQGCPRWTIIVFVHFRFTKSRRAGSSKAKLSSPARPP